ncbi:hypothetical protein BC831DRAFT_436608 [Entophlyctis helioformis]|nr:hypothetical protein BC831DRAFT_436608 [Entophlyctis helioformis]
MSDRPAAGAITVIARLTSGDKVPIAVADAASATVGDLKDLVAAATALAPSSLRLVLRGRILKDDEALLADYAVADNDVLHVARTDGGSTSAPSPAPPSPATAASTSTTATAATAATAAASLFGRPSSAASPSRSAAAAASSSNTVPTPGISGPALAAGLANPGGGGGGVGGMPDMSALMDNPFMAALLDNPEFLKSILEADPRFKAMTEEHPEMRAVLSDPDRLREMGRAIRNPRLLQEMMRNQDRAMSNIEAIPGGFNFLSSMYKKFEDPLSATATPDPSTGQPPDGCCAGCHIPVDAGSTQCICLPNPWEVHRNTNTNANANRAAQSGAATPAAAGVAGATGAAGNPFGAFGFPPFGLPPASAALRPGPALNPFMMFPPPPSTSTSTASSSAAAGSANPYGGPQQPPNMAAMMQQLQMMESMFAQRAGQLPSQSQPAQGLGQAPSGFNPFMGLFGGMPPAYGASPFAADRFKEQLAALRDMGFTDVEANKRALLAAGGNTEAAIGYLLGA